jgi:hypothetical protein
MRKKLVYISSNDGSDTRIVKEVRTLSGDFDIIFLGVGAYGERNYAKAYCSDFKLIQGKRNRPGTILRHVWLFLGVLVRNKVHSVHVINEQLMIFFYPFLFGKKVVLDLFDSFFLMHVNMPGNSWSVIKRLVYAPVDTILVTDENRFRLTNDRAKGKTSILPNYPNRHPAYAKASDPRYTTMFYSGTMNLERGTSLLRDLLKADPRIRVIMAGWITDEETTELSKAAGVDFRGVMPQEKALEIAAWECDYVLCLYSPHSDNNINASPNKIYDAIQTGTPVIINAEVKVSAFVVQQDLGYVLNNYNEYDAVAVAEELTARKSSYAFHPELREAYTWESVEQVLIEAHS